MEEIITACFSPNSFVVTVKKDTNTPVRFRSYPQKDDGDIDTCAIWEAGRATSAAPLYFPTMKVVVKGVENEYFDGGMISNNPIQDLKQEISYEFNSQQPQCVISLGTGKVDKAAEDRSFGSKLLKWATGGFGKIGWTLLTLATDTEAKHLEIMDEDEYRDFRKNYYRFNVEGNMGSIGLDQWKRMPEMRHATEAYLDSQSIADLIIQCANKLD